MSGGHYKYCPYEVTDGLADFSDDQETKERFPKLATVLSDLAYELGSILHNLDLDLSRDSYIVDDVAFEKEAILALNKCISLQEGSDAV